MHKAHHEFNDTISIAAQYVHPLEAVIGIGVFYSGPFMLGRSMHYHTFYLYAILRYFEGYDGHAGYEFPWSILRIMPFSSDAVFHQFHHSDNTGNFGSFTRFWDTLFDSSNDFYVKYPEGTLPVCKDNSKSDNDEIQK